MKVVRPVLMCLNETDSKIHKWKFLSDTFPIQNGLMLYHHCFLTLFYNTPLERSKKTKKDLN
jgi:hypothetical protein